MKKMKIESKSGNLTVAATDLATITAFVEMKLLPKLQHFASECGNIAATTIEWCITHTRQNGVSVKYTIAVAVA